MWVNTWCELDEDQYQSFVNTANRSVSVPHQAVNGRGIVICSGGRYDVCTYVLVNRLRQLGCTLPVQVWYRGEPERNGLLQDALRPLGVAFIDAKAVRLAHPARILRGWELKPYAMIHSPFREVLLLDADNVPVVDPTYLFDAGPYREHGAANKRINDFVGEDECFALVAEYHRLLKDVGRNSRTKVPNRLCG